jgi:hypothetical protein
VVGQPFHQLQQGGSLNIYNMKMGVAYTSGRLAIPPASAGLCPNI